MPGLEESVGCAAAGRRIYARSCGGPCDTMCRSRPCASSAFVSARRVVAVIGAPTIAVIVVMGNVLMLIIVIVVAVVL